MTRALALLDADDDIDRVHRAIEQARAVGGDLAWLGDILTARINAPPRRVARRDEAIVELASRCPPGSVRAMASAILAKLRRYERTHWRTEQKMLSAPLVRGDEGRALHACMLNSGKGGAPGFETIRAALALVKNRPVSITQNDPQNANQLNEESTA